MAILTTKIIHQRHFDIYQKLIHSTLHIPKHLCFEALQQSNLLVLKKMQDFPCDRFLNICYPSEIFPRYYDLYIIMSYLIHSVIHNPACFHPSLQYQVGTLTPMSLMTTSLPLPQSLQVATTITSLSRTPQPSLAHSLEVHDTLDSHYYSLETHWTIFLGKCIYDPYIWTPNERQHCCSFQNYVKICPSTQKEQQHFLEKQRLSTWCNFSNSRHDKTCQYPLVLNYFHPKYNSEHR